MSAKYCKKLSQRSTGVMAASSPENCHRIASSYPPGLLVLNHPSEEFRSPDNDGNDDSDDDAADDSADAARRRSPPTGWLERRDTGWTAGAADSSEGQSSRSGEAEAEPVTRAERDAAAVAAARRAPRRGSSPPASARGASPARPSARSRPLASTPMPAMGQAPLSSRRPRRDVARPISYEEPSLSVKMRK